MSKELSSSLLEDGPTWGGGVAFSDSSEPVPDLESIELQKRRRKCLLLYVLFIVAVVSSVALYFSNPFEEEDGNGSKPDDFSGLPTNFTDAQVESILSKVDFTVDPCEDFYSYACGSYVKDNNPSIHPEKPDASNLFTTLDRVLQDRLRRIVDMVWPGELQKFREQCVLGDPNPAKSFNPFLEIIESIHDLPSFGKALGALHRSGIARTAVMQPSFQSNPSSTEGYKSQQYLVVIGTFAEYNLLWLRSPDKDKLFGILSSRYDVVAVV